MNSVQQTLEAVYENGVFRPLEKIEMAEGQLVRLIVETLPEDLLELAAQVYEGLSDKEIDEIEQIALDRRPFFGERTS